MQRLNKLTKPSVIRFLSNALPKVNDFVPAINHGGCGIFASILAERLAEKKIPFKIFAIYESYYTGSDELEQFNHFLETGEIMSSQCGVQHVVVKVYDKYFDSDGEFNEIDNYRFKIEISKERLDKLIEHKECWSSWFNRNEIPKIKSNLTKVFNYFPAAAA